MISVHMQNLDVFASRDIERVVYLQYGVLQTRAVPNSGCVVFGRIRIIDATIRPNTNRIRIVEV